MFDVIACAMRVERVDAEFPAVVRVDEHQLRGDILHNVRDVMLMQQLHNRVPRRDGAYFVVAQDRVHLIDHLHRVALRRRHDRSHCCKNATNLNACSYYCVLKALQSWSHKLPRVCRSHCRLAKPCTAKLQPLSGHQHHSETNQYETARGTNLKNQTPPVTPETNKNKRKPAERWGEPWGLH